ncbi:PTS sugar transporter subunit IIA [Ponticoccus sp. SC2-23]|uniref:PTS sugar transporter subunit IIA n=1 Tax=Alexandriicola marinus TaxID=2081710 RepID=UPI000FDAED2E|nr:PTS sugar transporter subunit IIA [Alexandriicola marinus]MBM1220663.1 PTS sugar transporter subunit IIA [Ponticoccus sp. SC6-9]MBM1225922.1 PTS sugar transporter subunit IIA [Ponticoccus sp. SC6-15]MBM1231219.1 PTS sugar transporter subunit IIA [Ponticoccus sp. SC6-38]MBM1235920.1 PTS sugar transporter subunit IIA [Ponticoccus sp. SC6-45]MBM1240241.1 PTS sugar transporter subunit IIA [Ponticoccus sp. SC6-49]MBM1244776.1 PTS sugar transporter subunit IIA [Ponticoccus sp. SC2-64]MBM1249394
MQLSKILRPECVKLLNGATSKKRLFQDIAELAQSVYGLGQSQVLDALLERETLGPTGVGQGVALPHARLHEIDRVCGLFFRLDRPLEFESVDRQPVDLVFTLFAPENAGVEHLKALALVSRTLRDPGICAKLRANDDAHTLHTILTETTSSQAA